MRYTIKTLNHIADIGLQQFSDEQYSVSSDHNEADAILVRSTNMHELTLPERTLVVGRAGAGTNNIPIEQLTARGIPVLNTPGANANAVKELVITGMLLACRNICPAWDYVRQLQGDNETLHKAVESKKKQFAGFELPGKTLAVIGLGQIGVKVANAAADLGMKVIGYDPAITVQNAWQLASHVKQAQNINDALNQADFVSVHVPLNDKTRGLINANQLSLLKPGVILLNFARDGIIDNAALAEAIEQDHVRNYVCDFPSTQLKDKPQVISLPHLGASTQEAEENCAKMIAEQVKLYLEQGNIKNAVNFPKIMLPPQGEHRIAVINKNVPNMVAQISTALSRANINISDMINKSRGDIAYTMLDINAPADQTTLEAILAIDGVIRVRTLTH